MSTTTPHLHDPHRPDLFMAACLFAAILAVSPITLALDSPTTQSAPADNSPAKPVLVTGDRLAIIGDSITEQKIYSRFMEDYLTACTPQLNLWIIQLGWSGETAAGFLARMTPDLLSLKTTVITTCYGMNDGGYSPYKAITGEKYTRSMTDLVERAKKADVRVAIVGSPGIVGKDWPKNTFFVNSGVTSAVYNDTLAKLTEIDRHLAAREAMVFADLNDQMKETVDAAQAANGKKYAVCGGDGIHPGPNGHLIMAYSFLKAMGIDGQIAVITIDMNGSTQTTPGHKVIQSSNGKVEIESTRYPFCFPRDPFHRNDSAESILPFLPFNQDLNRFMLVVRGSRPTRLRSPGATCPKRSRANNWKRASTWPPSSPRAIPL